MPDICVLFVYVILQFGYLLVMKGRYVQKTNASIFSGVCDHNNCGYQVVKAVFSKDELSKNLDFLQVS